MNGLQWIMLKFHMSGFLSISERHGYCREYLLYRLQQSVNRWHMQRTLGAFIDWWMCVCGGVCGLDTCFSVHWRKEWSSCATRWNPDWTAHSSPIAVGEWPLPLLIACGSYGYGRTHAARKSRQVLCARVVGGRCCCQRTQQLHEIVITRGVEWISPAPGDRGRSSSSIRQITDKMSRTIAWLTPPCGLQSAC